MTQEMDAAVDAAGLGDPPTGMSSVTWEAMHEAWKSPSDTWIHQLATAHLETARQLSVQRAQNTTQETTVQTLRQRANAHESDLRIIADALRNEAVEREWCDEYGRFVDRVNRITNGDWLERCDNTYAVSVLVRLVIETKDSDAARGMADDDLSLLASRSSYDLSYEIQDVSLD
jgi:hypothetical protein